MASIKKIRQYIFSENFEALFFLIMASLFGLLIIILSPPMQAPDETTHYWRAYQISELDLFADTFSDGRQGYAIPAEIKEFSDDLSSGTNPKAKMDGDKLYRYVKKNSYDNPVPVSFENTAIYSPSLYIPQSLALGLGNLLKLPHVISFYLARLANLSLYILLIYFSIKIVPIGKKLLITLGLLPMSLYAASSISVDASLIAFSFLAIALTLNLLQSKASHDSKRKLLFLLILLLFLLSVGKNGYFLFSLLLLAIPSDFYGRKNGFVIKLGIIFSIISVGFIWNLAVYDTAEKIHFILRPGELIDPNLQLKYIMSNPFSLVSVILNTFILKSGTLILMSFVGILGWLDIVLPYVAYFIAPMLLYNSFQSSKKDDALVPPKEIKILFSAIIVLLSVATVGSLYLGYSQVGANYVEGLQGRYFIPIIALLVPFASAMSLKEKSSINKFFVIGVITLLSLTCFTLLNANILRINY